MDGRGNDDATRRRAGDPKMTAAVVKLDEWRAKRQDWFAAPFFA